MRISTLSVRLRALAASLVVVASCLVLGTGTAAAATCPTVDPGTGAVSPAPSVNADWSGCDLHGAYLFMAKMVSMNLSGADLSNANLMVADVSGGDWSGADLSGANLGSSAVSANLTNANFSGANMAYTDLSAATISGANMGTATLTGIKTFATKGVPASLPSGWEDVDSTILGPTADAWEALLSGADLHGLNLDQANLTGADLSKTNLTGTDLAQATLAGVHSGGITGTPSLPAGWLLINGYLVGNGANLNGASLPGADLAGFNFSSTDLASADLSGANLSGADLDSANLAQTNFTDADLTTSSAVSANLTGANLSGATTAGLNLTKANLKGSDLAGTDLSGATLTGIESGSVTGTATLPTGWAQFNGYLVGPSANLSGADLSGLGLADADLAGANLTHAVLTGASIPSANLTSANLSNVDLSSASLSKADLTSASLADANLTDASLDGATITSTDFTGVTWSNTTCPDGSNSDAYDSGCFSPLDTLAPVPHPFLMSGGTEVNGWFNASVTVNWAWTDDGTLSPTACTHFSTTTTNGPVTLSASCSDISGHTSSDSMSLQVDATRPVVKVTGVVKGRHYLIGKVPAAGCSTSEAISGVATQATVSVTTGGSGGVGPFTATCAGAVSLAGLPQAAPAQVKYTIGYGFGGFISPRPGSTVSRSTGLTSAFRLTSANGTAIASRIASNLAAARDVRVILKGPGIRPVTVSCSWSSSSHEFRCPIKIPATVRTGKTNSYTITAQENIGTGFYAVPAVGTARNPEVIHFK